MKQKIKEEQEEIETHNGITIGELCLTSSDLPMSELINYVIGLLQDKTIKDYLQDLNQRRLFNQAKSYMS